MILEEENGFLEEGDDGPRSGNDVDSSSCSGYNWFISHAHVLHYSSLLTNVDLLQLEKVDARG